MKAVQLIETGTPLQSRDVSLPDVGPEDVLVRITAAGICHSDVHYRGGVTQVAHVPMTLGHEVAGIVEDVGSDIDQDLRNRRVALHYLVTCGACHHCRSGHEQFCGSGQMIGKHRDGGYAEYIVVPARNAVLLPDNVSNEHAAIMMCSTATSYHALRQARLRSGETVAVIGCGGLGMSAILLAKILGAGLILAVDIDAQKLDLAARSGAIPIDGRDRPAQAILDTISGAGVDVALELIGSRRTFELAVDILAPKGRAALAGITTDRLSVQPYPELINREAEIIGVSDHLLTELTEIMQFASDGRLNLSPLVSRSVPLNAERINAVLDELQAGTSTIRSVITAWA